MATSPHKNSLIYSTGRELPNYLFSYNSIAKLSSSKFTKAPKFCHDIERLLPTLKPSLKQVLPFLYMYHKTG